MGTVGDAPARSTLLNKGAVGVATRESGTFIERSITTQQKKKKKKPTVPEAPEGVTARTLARKRAALDAQRRRGRTSTILSDALG